MENIFKTIVAIATGAITYLFGGADTLLLTLVAVVVLDYITGVAKAYVLSDLSSKAGFKGIVKKLMYFAIVAVAVFTDNTAASVLPDAEGAIRAVVIGFLIANEAISILENCAAANLSVPKILIKVLEKLKDNGNE